MQSEIAQLKSELETLRIQKKVVEEERIQNDEERNKEVSRHFSETSIPFVTTDVCTYVQECFVNCSTNFKNHFRYRNW